MHQRLARLDVLHWSPLAIPSTILALLLIAFSLGALIDQLPAWLVLTSWSAAFVAFEATYFGWMAVAVVQLNSVLDDAQQVPTRLLVWSLAFVVAYLPVFIGVVIFSPHDAVFLVPFHAFATFTNFYALFSLTRALRRAERRRARTTRAVLTFLSLWWFALPIGAAWVQRRLNAIARER